jgi:hypothetical protein
VLIQLLVRLDVERVRQLIPNYLIDPDAVAAAVFTWSSASPRLVRKTVRWSLSPRQQGRRKGMDSRG